MIRPTRELLAQIALGNLPPTIVQHLLDDQDFISEWNIETTTTITLGEDGLVFERDKFFDAIRAGIDDPEVEKTVAGVNGSLWKVVVRTEGGELRVCLIGRSKRYELRSHAALASDPGFRVAWFDRLCAETNFLDAMSARWRTRLSAPEALRDDEFARLVEDTELTPVAVFQNLRMHLSNGSTDLSSLIPIASQYYERFVGSTDPSASVDDYLENGASKAIASWLDWKPEDGFRYALSICSVSALSSRVRLPDVEVDTLVEIFSRIATDGDPMSKIAGLEVALANCRKHPILNSFIEAVVTDFIEDDPDRDESGFALFSWIAVLVAAELSRRKVLSGHRPFYRKQASLAQASLVLRAFSGVSVDRAVLVPWARELGLSHSYYLQGLIDLRLEPRWFPDFISPDHIRADFIGRIRNAVAANNDNIVSETLRSLMIGRDSLLEKAAAWPLTVFPSPLEGSIEPKGAVPEHILKQVRQSLEAEKLTSDSFALLVNISLIHVPPLELPELAAAALRRVRYSLSDLDDDGRIFSLISGLAVVAAVCRSEELAEAVRAFSRVLRRRRRFTPKVTDEIRIAMVASASHFDEAKWASFAGEWLTEVAFEVSDKIQAGQLLSMLRQMTKLEPKLVACFAKADAALAAFTY